ncbi:MAG: hypothetical protein ACT4O3_04490 [Elusimicrobiota bacterium]
MSRRAVSLLLLAAALFAARPAPAQDALYLELSAHGQRLNLGLADFVSVRSSVEEAARARGMRDVVKYDLLFQRIFNLIEGGPAPLRRRILFDAWRDAKADLLVTGTLSAAREGRFEFTGALYDVRSKQVVLEKRYLGDPGQERSVAHRWADEVVRYFIGRPGVAGTPIYFVNDATGKKEVCAVDYDGANFRRLTNDRSIALLPKASPDGKWIAYTTFRDGGPRLYLLSADGREKRLLCGYEGLNASAAWFPDGQSLAATLSLGGEPNIHQVGLDGKIMRALTRSFSVDTAPAFSPDGLRMAFTSDRPGYPQIYAMDVSGANLKRLTRLGECDSAAWSPQGNVIAFAMSQSKGNFDIHTLEIASGSQQRLTWGTGNNENPAWSPDGRHLVFTSTRRGRSELWIMGLDGSNQQPLGQIPGNSFTPHWGPWPVEEGSR